MNSVHLARRSMLMIISGIIVLDMAVLCQKSPKLSHSSSSLSFIERVSSAFEMDDSLSVHDSNESLLQINLNQQQLQKQQQAQHLMGHESHQTQMLNDTRNVRQVSYKETHREVKMESQRLYVNYNPTDDQGFRLRPQPTHFIVAPLRVRPNQEVQIYVAILKLYQPFIDIYAAIRKEGRAYAETTERFTSNSVRTIILKMPDNADPGNYTLRVHGSCNEYSQGQSGFLFENETDLMYHPKQLSVFVQTDRTIYRNKNWVDFRVVAIYRNLLPVRSTSITIYVKDASGRTCRRWLQEQLYNGVYANKFFIDYPAAYGIWRIEVEAKGYTFVRNITVENWSGTRFDVNLTMPAIVRDNEFGLAGVVRVNNTNGMTCKGNVTVLLEIIDPTKPDSTPSLFTRFASWVTPPKNSTHPTIVTPIPFINGVASFIFPMVDIKKMTTQLIGTKLRVYATFYDWETLDEKSNVGTAVVINSGAFIKFLGGNVRTFKPGQPLLIYISVVGYNGEKLERFHNRKIVVQRVVKQMNGLTLASDEESFLIPDTSIVEYDYTPEDDDELIKIRAYLGAAENVIELSAYRHFSRQNDYIHIETSTTDPAIDTYMVFTVKLSTYVPLVHYQIVSGGNPIVASQLIMHSRQKTFSLALSRDMIPYSHLIVFAILPSGEVITDCVNFYVDGFGIQQDLYLRTSNGNDITGSTFELEFIDEPSMWVAVSGTLFELYQRGASNFFTKDMVEEELETYDDHVNNTYKQLWYKEYEQKENVHFTAATTAIDANTTFAFAGLIVFTDADLARIPGSIECNHTRGYLPCFDGNCYQIEQHCDGVRQCEDGADEMGCPTTDPTVRPDLLSLDVQGRTHYHYDESMWVWKNGYTQPNGRIDLSIAVPNRRSFWNLNGFGLSHETGLKFHQIPMLYDTVQYAFMFLEVPAQAYRGEQLGVQVTVFNGIHKYAEVLLTLLGSDNYRFVVTEDYGFVRSYDPRLRDGDIQTLVYLPPMGMRYIHFPIVPIKFGRIEVSVEMAFGAAISGLSEFVNVMFDGITNVYHTPYLIDLVNSGSLVIPDLKVAVLERFIDPGERKHLYVPGSENASVSVTGGIVGPGIDPFDYNLDASNVLRRVSSGTAESYMFNVGIDIYWLRYLWFSNQLNNATLVETLENTNKDLTSLFAYMLNEGENDGAFVMYRRRSEPSIWLTAHALEILSDSVETQWERLFFIDTNIVNTIAVWLTRQQDNVTGAFHERTIHYDRKMLDPKNQIDENGQSYNISLTAYTIIALAKAERVATGVAASVVKRSIQMASNYVASHLDKISEPFQICIVTYALYLAKHRSKSDAFMQMIAAQRKDEHVYWSDEPIPKNIFTMIDNIQTLMPHQDQPHEGRAIQATSYALLVYLTNNKYQEAIPIMKFLQTQRNTDSGFASTQDTLVAIQALSEFAHRDTNRALYTMRVSLTATSTPNWTSDVMLPNHEFGEYHKNWIPKVFGSVRSRVEGVGYALMQLTTLVNVEYDEKIRKPVRPSFDLIVDRLVFTGRNGSRFDMTVCTRWLVTELSPRSGLAVIEIDIPTGYWVYRQTILEEELKPENSDIWKRSRFENQRLYLHVDYIPADWRCFAFYAVRLLPVANGTIQHLLRIYEYHEPGNYNATLYTTYDLFHHHICQVCGSFQCPYCTHYNIAQTSLPNIFLVVSLSCFVTLLVTLSAASTVRQPVTLSAATVTLLATFSRLRLTREFLVDDIS